MKVGLLPGRTGPSSGSAKASLSLMPFSIPLLIFSGSTAVFPKNSCRHRAKRVKQGAAKGCRSDQAAKVRDQQEGRAVRGEGRGQHLVHSPLRPLCPQARALLSK